MSIKTAVLIALGIYFVLQFIAAWMFRQVAFAKGYDEKAHAFAMVFWLNIIGAIYVAALPDLHLREQNEKLLGAMNKEENR